MAILVTLPEHNLVTRVPENICPMKKLQYARPFRIVRRFSTQCKVVVRSASNTPSKLFARPNKSIPANKTVLDFEPVSFINDACVRKHAVEPKKSARITSVIAFDFSQRATAITMFAQVFSIRTQYSELLKTPYVQRGDLPPFPPGFRVSRRPARDLLRLN